jgi:hypothetical protein
MEAEADWDDLHTPETYLGYERREHLVSLAGEWTTGRENVVLDGAPGSITYRFHPRDAHLVMSPGGREPIPFRVLLDGEAPGPSHGLDIDGEGAAHSRTAACTSSCASTTRSVSGPWRSRSWEPGAEAYVFTFG